MGSWQADRPVLVETEGACMPVTAVRPTGRGMLMVALWSGWACRCWMSTWSPWLAGAGRIRSWLWPVTWRTGPGRAGMCQARIGTALSGGLWRGPAGVGGSRISRLASSLATALPDWDRVDGVAGDPAYGDSGD